MRNLTLLLRTDDDRMLALLRFVLGSVMFAHGAQKALGWFGGAGFGPTMQYFAENLGIAAPLAVLAIGAEFLGGLLLLAGLLARVCALGIAINMIVAVALVHWPHGFFMNWFGTKAGEGFEYHILALALASVIVVRGAGAWSLDPRLAQKLEQRGGEIPVTPARTDRLMPGMPRGICASLVWVRSQHHRRA